LIIITNKVAFIKLEKIKIKRNISNHN
jgi:hypothetical protein